MPNTKRTRGRPRKTAQPGELLGAGALGIENLELGSDSTSLPNEDDSLLEISIDAPPAAPILSFKEKLMQKFGTGGAAESKPSPRGKKKSILVDLIPALSLLVCAYASNKLGDDYKECGPRQEEMQAILLPIASIIDRRIKVSGKVSPDVEDMIACLLAITLFSYRSIETYKKIRREKDAPSNISYFPGTRQADYQTQNGNATNGLQRDSSYHADASSTAYDGRAASYDGRGDVEQEERSPAQIIDLALRRDVEYRIQHGLN